MKNEHTTLMASSPQGSRTTRTHLGRSGTALLLSAVVHSIILLILSLIVLTSVTEMSPVMTVLFDAHDGDMAEFESAPEISMPVPTAESDVAETDVTINNLTESDLALPESFFSKTVEPVETKVVTGRPSASAARPTSGKTADAAAVSMIQKRVGREGGRKGEVQFSLVWANTNDVDLHVISPSGERISHDHRRSQCHGALDVDMNVEPESDEPVENVRWLLNQAPPGRYTVIINLFRIHSGRGRTDYQILVNLGIDSEIVEETVGNGKGLVVHRFQYAPQTWSEKRRQLYLEQLERKQESEEERAQVMLDRVTGMEKGEVRDVRLYDIVNRYPHTDAAIAALKLVSNTATK